MSTLSGMFASGGLLSGSLASGQVLTSYFPSPCMTTPDDFLFLVELLVKGQEKELLNALRDKPKDGETRLVYADWLEENGRDESAKKVREGYTPTGVNQYKRGSTATGSMGGFASGGM